MKNIDFVIKKVADKNGMDEKLVDKIVKHHWKKDIRNEIFSNKHSAIYLRHIGTMVFSIMKTRTAIEKTIGNIRRAKINPKWTDEKRVKIIEKYTNHLRNLLVQRNLLAIKFKETGDVIEAKRICKDTATSIEEPGTDIEWVD